METNYIQSKQINTIKKQLHISKKQFLNLAIKKLEGCLQELQYIKKELEKEKCYANKNRRY